MHVRNHLAFYLKIEMSSLIRKIINNGDMLNHLHRTQAPSQTNIKLEFHRHRIQDNSMKDDQTRSVK